MAIQRLSPTASLLRNSRLFSLPPPLPRPNHDRGGGSNLASDTATLPYPTHAAIETTQSSLDRGDWGLKRSLPQKFISKTSTPVIRIDDVDSIDHITEFDSAADHSLTLRKWQEMGMPLSMPAERRRVTKVASDVNSRFTSPTSVFEPSLDNTENFQDANGRKRWKFKGPWLAGQTDGAFERYVQKQIRSRKLDFREFLRKSLLAQKTFSRRRAAQENGEQDLEETIEVSNSELDLYIKDLRYNEQQLNILVEEFLDLPTSSKPAQNELYVMSTGEKGPPKAHLSAGLSYLRTGSYIHNHPVLGPMEEAPPVQARVLRPQSSSATGQRKLHALLGIGGVAGDDLVASSHQSTERPGIARYDPDIPGGAKVWVHPARASIDSHGRIKLDSKPAVKETLAIYEGKEIAIVSKPPAFTRGQDRVVPRLDSDRPQPKGVGDRSYGLGQTTDGNMADSLSAITDLNIFGAENADSFPN
ncbi:MAG: hypothetical protein Q9190_001473 [Brigantiaea leucoxantha]